MLPGIVTGDFDSIDSIPDANAIQVIPAKEQTATDFEKALRLVPGSTRTLIILGGTGLRSDHFLTNLLIAAAQPSNRSVVFLDDYQRIHRVTPECPLEESIPEGTIVSLIPFSNCDGVSTSGLHWDLDGQPMGPGIRLGQSNIARQDPVFVEIASGCLFVVVNQQNG